MSLFVEHRGGLSNEHRVRSGTVSCIPLQLNLHFSGHGFWRLRRWGSAGSWVNKVFIRFCVTEHVTRQSRKGVQKLIC